MIDTYTALDLETTGLSTKHDRIIEIGAVILKDGQEIDRFAPADLENEPRTYAHNGYTLTVTAEGGGLRVAEADCPTQDCVHTGTITRSGQSIVCLPARIVIQLTGGQPDGDAVDIVIG